ncbi:transmembrane protein 138-like [Portunus trituberculatus]|uniref:transmembrane protein 138-like n=1 Tax=Portunus trituberculatus TaxID=210409 RepID=UPI001E1CFA8E|nr:transmembrane protein 138-like [Portunus trituberculatus]XP_045101864.1 transmembrane protein 138-like [Portunus trituberculatus]XP_045101865.1 transmembrane protein 138-like [Portunus trituberculatus]XP_045101866.1 transmembrane protein 138-like [Portunus trituberculatus]XP_045101867.1 transmembrane protein 138-like [Portunus trituberculatus]
MAWDGINRYQWLSGISLALLSADLILNALFQVFSHNHLLTLLIYIIQDVCLVFSLILLCLALFSTTYTQAGLVDELLQRFLWCICTAVAYLGLSLGFHSWSLKQVWLKSDVYIWSHGMVSLFTLQRTVGCLHYYLYKKTILQLSDKTFYSALPVAVFK